VRLAARPTGGYRPQIAAGADGRLHVVYYDRVAAGDIVRYLTSADGTTWAPPETVSQEKGRNWGPDLVVRDDGTAVVVWDHAEEDFRSRGWLRVRGAAGWGTMEALTPDGARESGSGHVAHGPGDALAYVFIGKPLDPAERFRAFWTWRGAGGAWSDAQAFSEGVADAWHSNVERRPDGSVLAGFDVGAGGTETTLYVAEGRDGRFTAPEDMTRTAPPGERPNFAFAPDGVDLVTWFRRVGGVPVHVYVRSGRPGAWGEAAEPSKGLGGYQFDPDVAINRDGVRALVWGWDGGGDAELVYSLDRGQGWEPARKVADVDWGKPGLPSIDADPSGAFHVVWNQGVRGENEVFYARLAP